MKWADVLKDKSLQDLPYKIELNAGGQIVMSPATNRHGMFQSRISALLNRTVKSGAVISECSIDTLDGVKVADVAWASEGFIRKHDYQTPYTQAPDICVEIVSPSNSDEEIQQKIMLYLAKGAKEVWVCDETGGIAFNDHSGEMVRSKIAPRFPSKIV
jgi:Uma2 family endonuclease